MVSSSEGDRRREGEQAITLRHVVLAVAQLSDTFLEIQCRTRHTRAEET
jgi:hypothetical protein